MFEKIPHPTPNSIKSNPKTNQNAPKQIPHIARDLPPILLLFLILLNPTKPKTIANIEGICPKIGIHPIKIERIPNTKDTVAIPDVT